MPIKIKNALLDEIILDNNCELLSSFMIELELYICCLNLISSLLTPFEISTPSIAAKFLESILSRLLKLLSKLSISPQYSFLLFL